MGEVICASEEGAEAAEGNQPAHELKERGEQVNK